jgi:hypothetical protein
VITTETPAAAVPRQSIRSILALAPNGALVAPLEFPELGRYLREHYDTQDEKDRNARHCLRDEAYHDGGTHHMREQVIEKIFLDDDVKKKRKAMVSITRFDNPLKRVVNELATVYAEPAKRSVDGSADNQQRYKDVLDAVDMDEQMWHFSRLLNLHRAMLMRFRVRELPTGDREPVLDWATPSIVRAVLHPNDAKLVVGWLIQTAYRTANKLITVPSWTLWTDYESVQLRADMSPIVETYAEHGLGRNPWVAVSLSPPTAGFWPGEEGEDLVAAALATWLANVLLLKETKSATKQETITGDGRDTARAQGADSEIPRELSDGQGLIVTDTSMDLGMFQGVSDHVLEHVAQNYGMSSALIKQQGVQSADARELMRVPLRELRLHQQTPLRKFEKKLVLVMVAVLQKDMPELAFDPAGWHMQFGESQTPLSRNDAVDLFVKEREAGVDNTVDYIMRRDHCDEEQAKAQMKRNYDMEEIRNEYARTLGQINGGSGGANGAPAAAAPPGTTPAPQAAGIPPVTDAQILKTLYTK